MKKFTVKDFFKLIRLIDALNIHDDIFKIQKDSEDVARIGFDIILTVITKATTVESEKLIYECFSSILNEDVENMDLIQLVERVYAALDIVSFINFYKRVKHLD